MHRLSLIGLTSFALVTACTDDSSTGTTTGEDTSGTGSATTGTSTTASTTAVDGTGSSGGPTTTGVDSSTGAQLCGNGELDDDEDCDDDNNEDFDACRADCTLPFEEGWTVSYNGPAGNADSFSEVVIDGPGNIYVTGSHRVTDQGANLLVKQYLPDGTEGWTYEYNGAFNGNDSGADLVLHPSGDLIVVGTTETMNQGDNFLVMRLAATDQSEVWVDEYDGPGSGVEDYSNDDFAAGVAVDADGNVVAIGTQRNDDEIYDIVVRKYDADGGGLWTETFGGAFADRDFGDSVAIDAAGNIYALGTERFDVQMDQGWLRKYDADGVEVWTETVAWIPRDVTLDADENIVLTGYGLSGSDIAVVKYDPDFMQLWALEKDVANDFDTGSSLFVGDDGNVYVAGSSAKMGEQDNLWAGKLDADGAGLWSFTYDNAMASLADFGSGIAVDGDGNVVVCGSETVLGEQSNGWLRKLSQL